MAPRSLEEEIRQAPCLIWSAGSEVRPIAVRDNDRRHRFHARSLLPRMGMVYV